MCGSLCGNDFQLRTPYFSLSLSGTGMASGALGDFDLTYPDASIFGGNLGAGFETALQMYYPRNEDPESGAFSGLGGSIGYSHMWELDGSGLNIYNGQFHVFLSDAQLAVAVGVAVLHRATDEGSQFGGALDLDVIYRFRSPMLDRAVVNPFVGGGVLIGGFGGQGEGGFLLAPVVKLGLEFGWL